MILFLQLNLEHDAYCQGLQNKEALQMHKIPHLAGAPARGSRVGKRPPWKYQGGRIETMHLPCTVFELVSYLSKVTYFNLPHLHLVAPLGVTPFQFC